MPTAKPVLVARLALLLALTGNILIFALPGRANDAAVVLVVAAAAVGLLACLSLAARRPRLWPVLGALSCVGVAYPMVYLSSLPANSAAIPIGEVGALFISIGVMIATIIQLPGAVRRRVPRR